jgi:hypothetical protein
MLTPKMRPLALVALLVATAPMLACYDDELAPPVYAYGYQPQSYDGYVVYYDGVGRPFYYGGGGPMWVPETSPFYSRLVAHWHTYGGAYGQWNAHYGARYRGYRSGGGGGGRRR